MRVSKFLLGTMLAAAAALPAKESAGQAMPATAGETLSGKRVVLADAVRGHPTVLVAGFSRGGGNACAAWVKALHGDSALSGVTVYQMAMIAGAPGMMRGMIKNNMKKGVPPAEQENFVVLTQDENSWRSYFEVSADQDPYVILMDGSGKVLWHGHGSPDNLEPMVRAALQ
jgi:hypothetical protein